MPPFETAKLWTDSLALQTDSDKFAEIRESLRSAYMRFRERSALLAAEIVRDLPDYTVHDITHIDSLWHLTDLIAGDNVALTPLEAFVLGGAFLVHDLGNGLAAYPDGIASLRSSPIWDDAVALAIRHELGRAPTAAELRHPGPAVEGEILGSVLRRLHAEHAERLALVSWSDPVTTERYHLIEDPFLRLHFGKLIGRIAHSHWWPARNLTSEFSSIVGPPAGYPREWTVDPLMLACLLRVADAAHLDAARAPLWLKAIRKPRGKSATHWVFQEKLNQPISEGDRLLFTSVPFGVNDAESWWMCFDALQVLDQELSEVDSILADSHRKQLAVRGVQGAGQADRLCRWVQTDGWLPVDTRIRVNDVAGLAKELGGEQLYGANRLVPLRELMQNASDAIRARSYLQSWPPDRGEVIVRVGTDEHGHFVEVADNGVGMSQAVLTGYLLDFGRSFWSGSQVSEELPGLLASGFEPIGKYGIGFFSVFMWSKHVRVVSRRYDDAQAETHLLEFMAGLDSRPLLRKAATSECLHDGGTVVRVWLDKDPEGPEGILRLPDRERSADEGNLEAACLWLCPASDTNLFVQHQDEPRTTVLHASDWKTIPDKEFVLRTVTARPDADDEGEEEEEEEEDVMPTAKLLDFITRMLSPLRDIDGNLVGRLALIPSSWRYDWPLFGVVTVGGFRSATLLGAAGILVGTSTRASRDLAIPVVPLEQFHSWVREQESLVEENTQDPEALLECAATVRACGLMPEILPIAEGSDGLKTAAQIRNWSPMPDEFILVQDDALSLRRRSLGEVQIFPNVLSVNVGYRALLREEPGRPVQPWPINFLEFHEGTLEGAVAQLIAERWNISSERLTELIESGPERVAIGMSYGRVVRLRATILRRPA
jgi:hypothetical protein